MANSTEEILKERLRENLRKYRKEQGLTQEELAEKAGISLSGYKNIESGVRSTSLKTLAELGNALGIDAANLLLLDGKDKSMQNIHNLLQNKPESFIIAVETAIRVFSDAFGK